MYRISNLNVCVFPDLRDPFMVLSGGLSYDTVGRRACLTVMHGKSTAVLEMDYPIVDFLTLCETPYPNGELQQSTLDGFSQFVSESVSAQWNILVNFVLFLCIFFLRLSGTLCCGGPPREGFSCNRPRTDWVIVLLFKYRVFLVCIKKCEHYHLNRPYRDIVSNLTILIVSVRNVWKSALTRAVTVSYVLSWLTPIH